MTSSRKGHGPSVLLLTLILSLSLGCAATTSQPVGSKATAAEEAVAPRARKPRQSSAHRDLRKEALTIVRQMPELNDRTQACRSMVTMAVEQSRFKEARAVFHELRDLTAVSYGENDIELEGMRAVALAAAGRLEEGFRALDHAVTERDRQHRRWGVIAAHARRRGRFELAVSAIKRSLPNLDEVLELAEKLRSKNRRALAIALLDWKRGVARKDRQVWPGVQDLIELARAFHRYGDRSRMTQALSEASKMAGTFIRELFSLSLSCFELGWPKQGEAEFGRAFALLRRGLRRRSGDATTEKVFLSWPLRLAERYVALGRLDEARKLVEAIPMSRAREHRIAGLILLAAAREAVGQATTAAASSTMKRALKEWRRLRDRSRRTQTLMEAVAAAAPAVARISTDAAGRARAARLLLGLSSRASSAEARVWMLTAIARHAGADYRRLLGRAERLGRGLSDKQTRDQRLTDIAEAYLANGDFARSVAVSKRFRHATERAATLGSLVKLAPRSQRRVVLQRLGNELAAVRRSPVGPRRYEALRQIITTLAPLSKSKEIELEPPVLIELFEALAASTQPRFDELKKLMPLIPANPSLALLDSIQRAASLARGYDYERTDALARLVRYHLDANRGQQALRIVRQLTKGTNSAWYGEPLARVLVHLLVRAGVVEQVIDEIDRIPNPIAKSISLFAVSLATETRR